MTLDSKIRNLSRKNVLPQGFQLVFFSFCPSIILMRELLSHHIYKKKKNTDLFSFTDKSLFVYLAVLKNCINTIYTKPQKSIRA